MTSLERIGELLRTQDNRITDCPIFIVEQRKRIYGFDEDYAEDYDWIDFEGDYTKASPEEHELLDLKESKGESTGSFEKVYYQDTWEFVTACFTEQGCKDYLAINGHNLEETRIYAAGSYRNAEWRLVRDALMKGEVK